jgi:ketosteroid isomerase-like protein
LGKHHVRNTKESLVLACLLVFFSCLSCTNLIRLSEDAVNEAGVRRTLDLFFTAALKQDWEAAGNVMSEDFVIFTDGAKSYRKDEYVKLLKADNLLLKRYELRDLKLGTSGELAWVTYRGYFESTSHGMFSRVETLETLLFRSEAGKWRMFRAQATIRDLDKEKTN